MQFYILGQMMNYSLHYLSLLEKPFSYLRSEETLWAIPAEERLPFHRLLADILLWRGNLPEVKKLMRENPESFVASGMTGCIDFMLGTNELALKQFSADLQRLKRIGARRRMFFPGIAGLLFILALLKTGDISYFDRMRKFIDTVRTQQPDNMLLGAYEMVGHFLSAQEDGTVDLPLDSPVCSSNSITLLFAALLRFWLSGSLPASTTEPEGHDALRLLWSRARENGFQWIAMLLAELIGRVEQDQKMLDFAAGVGMKTGMASVADAVILEELWKRRLKALLSISGDSESLQAKIAGKCRMIWLVGYQGGLVTLSAREQRYCPGHG